MAKLKNLLRNYVLATPAILKVYMYIDSKLNSNDEAGLIFGRSGIGKTSCIKLLLSHIEKKHPEEYNIYSIVINATGSTSKISKKSFYAKLIADCGFDTPSRRTTGDQLQFYFHAQLLKHAKDVDKDIIFLIDCAEQLKRDHYSMLADTMNAIKRDNSNTDIKMFLFGTHDMCPIRTKYIELNDDVIVRRFLLCPYHMNGIKSEGDLRALFAQYDAKEYTQRFFPDAYEQGHRFQDEASKVYALIREHIADKDSIDISMKTICSLTDRIFNDYGIYGGKTTTWPTIKNYKNVLRNLQIVEQIRSSSKIEKDWIERQNIEIENDKELDTAS